MKTVKVAYIGWWEGFNVQDNLIYRILKKHYNVVVCDAGEADYSICSLYSHDFVNAPGVRIFYTAEAMVPDFNLFDYAIGFDEIEYGDRYVRIPNYIMNCGYLDDIECLRKRHLCEGSRREKFCAWVCSNGSGDCMRDVVFDKVCKYKNVDSAGRYRNNMGLTDGLADKRIFLQDYKFSLAIENTSFKGYTTEKLLQAFAAGGIPIYWGDPDVGKYFNTNSFINLNDFPTIDEGIERIKYLDSNEGEYNRILMERPLVDENHFEILEKRLDDFLVNIFEQPKEEAFRRPHGQTANWYVGKVKNGFVTDRENEEESRHLKSFLVLALNKLKNSFIGK